MKHLSKITSIQSTTFAIVNSTTPTQLSNTKEILTHGGVAVAVILALSIFLLTINRYQKTQVDSLANLIKIVKKK